MRGTWLVFGLLGVALAFAQWLAALGRVELTMWPFAQSSSRGIRQFTAAAYLALGIFGLVMAYVA